MDLTILDIGLLGLLLLSMISGARRGFIGILINLIATFIALLCAFAFGFPWIRQNLPQQLHELGYILALILFLLAGKLIGSILTTLLRTLFGLSVLRPINRILGAIGNAVVYLFLLLTVVLMMLPLGIPSITQNMNNSKVITYLLEHTPEPVKESIYTLQDRFTRTLYKTTGIDNSETAQGSTPNMPEILGQALPGLLPTAIPTEPPTTEQLSETIQDAGISVVKIHGYSPRCGYTSEGSGFVSSNGYVLTNAHVVQGAGQILLEKRDGYSVSGTPIYYNHEEDIAVLYAPALNLRGIPLGENATPGTALAVLGYPGGGPYTITPASVRALGNIQNIEAETQELSRVKYLYQINADIVRGNSGGPLIAENGEAVGMVFARSVAGDKIGYAIPATTIKEALANIPETPQAVLTGTCRVHH
ncbi:MarP family serine protease [Rothia sp. CCM 9419]|uniref:MarP family serine protease n=1 Tax=Rothia sp. CCM 9419 TaxID=3402662 RepID=UPI003AE6DA77